MTPDHGENGSPTMGEMSRRLDAAVREIRDLVQEVRQDRNQMHQTYLPREQYNALRQADDVQIAGLEREQHNLVKRLDAFESQQRTNRALVWGSLLFPILAALIVVILTSGGLR